MSVDAAMKALNRGVRKLTAQLSDSSGGRRDENLRLIGELQRFALAAKAAGPTQGALINAKDDAAKARIHTAYRRHLIDLLRALLDIEQDIADGKLEAAKPKVQALMKARDTAHDELGIGEEPAPQQPR